MLQLKKYRAFDKMHAYDVARRELGSDAVLFKEERVRQKGFTGLFKKRVWEVTFSYDPATIPAVLKRNTNFENAVLDKLNNNVSEASAVMVNESLVKRLDVLESTLAEFLNKFDIVKRDITYDYPDEIQVLLSRMIDEQVREELAHSYAKQTEKLMRSKPGSEASEILEHLMQEQFGRAEPILHKKFTQKVVLVLGPTGSGKTTTLVKLAADFVKQRKQVGIINTDVYRIGAEGQLQTYADILRVPFQKVYYPQELETVMKEMSDRDIIFVDTVGKRPGDEEYKNDMLEMIRILRPEDILLCLSATMSFASVKEMVDTYGFVDDYRLLITKLDETRFRGMLLNISWYTHRPLAYVTTGQDVPKDIKVADVERIVREIVRG